MQKSKRKQIQGVAFFSLRFPRENPTSDATFTGHRPVVTLSPRVSFEMISRELSMRLSAGLLPGRVNDRLVSGGSDLKFWLAQPRCPDIRETPPRCSHCCSVNSSLQLWLLLLEQAGLKEFCVQQALPDCGLHATFYSPLWYVQLDGCILTSLLETMGQLGHINDSFQKTCFLN